MPYLKDYRLFISHAWKYGETYNGLIRLLDAAPLFSYYNYSAPKEKPLFPPGTPYTSSEVARMISNKIGPSQITLVLSGMYGAYSEWMKYEIDESIRMGKPVIGIYPWGQTNAPSYVTSNANEMVRWNTDSIVSAIRRWV